jgi:hypothetical protein
LWAPHQALLKARERALRPLAEAFKRNFLSSVKTEEMDTAAVKVQGERLMEINRQYEFLQSVFPTWPLPRQTVRNLVATASLPTISSILSIMMPLLFPNLPAGILEILKHF